MSGVGGGSGWEFDAASTFDVSAAGEPHTFDLAGGDPVAFRFPAEASAVSLELEGPGKIVVPSRSPDDEARSFTADGTVELDLDEFTDVSVVGLELDGPGKVRVKTVVNPPRADG